MSSSTTTTIAKRCQNCKLDSSPFDSALGRLTARTRCTSFRHLMLPSQCQTQSHSNPKGDTTTTAVHSVSSSISTNDFYSLHDLDDVESTVSNEVVDEGEDGDEDAPSAAARAWRVSHIRRNILSRISRGQQVGCLCLSKESFGDVVEVLYRRLEISNLRSQIGRGVDLVSLSIPTL